MTISRRDTLRLAAAAGATRALGPFAVAPEDAAAMLAAPADADEFPYNWNDVTFDPFRDAVVDPVSFAVEHDSTDFGFVGGFANGAAEEWAEYKQALDRVIALNPELLDHTRQTGPHGQHPVVLLDEIIVAMGNTMHRAGIVVGVAYEHLRLAQMAPRMVCECNGHGCETCGGAGTLPTPRPTLGFWPADQRSPSQRMQDRLDRMSEAEQAELAALMEKGENTRKVLAYALGATDAEVQALLEILEAKVMDHHD